MLTKRIMTVTVLGNKNGPTVGYYSEHSLDTTLCKAYKARQDQVTSPTDILAKKVGEVSSFY